MPKTVKIDIDDLINMIEYIKRWKNREIFNYNKILKQEKQQVISNLEKEI
jgi:hypothetical protein